MKVMMQLKHNTMTLAEKTDKFQTDGSSNVFSVLFDYPIQVSEIDVRVCEREFVPD
jgi:hypothetical protein